MRRLSWHWFFHRRIACLTVAFLSGTAIAHAAEGMVSDRTFATALYGQAVRLTAIEDYSKAVSLLTRAVEVDPQFSDGFLLRGKLSQWLHSSEESIQQRTKEIATPKNTTSAILDALRQRGLAFYRVGRYREAIADFSTVLRQAPNEATTYYQRGLAFAALKDGPNALADYAVYRQLQQINATTKAARQAQVL